MNYHHCDTRKVADCKLDRDAAMNAVRYFAQTDKETPVVSTDKNMFLKMPALG
jgi:hypothetical protein